VTSISVEVDESPGSYREEVVSTDEDWGEVCIWADSVLNGLDRYVEIHNVDLLVIKKHHRNFFESFIHRSVTKEILENLHVPVLIHP
jgi:nucleotide-binding universal stress UspA family protein